MAEKSARMLLERICRFRLNRGGGRWTSIKRQEFSFVARFSRQNRALNHIHANLSRGKISATGVTTRPGMEFRRDVVFPLVKNSKYREGGRRFPFSRIETTANSMYTHIYTHTHARSRWLKFRGRDRYIGVCRNRQSKMRHVSRIPQFDSFRVFVFATRAGRREGIRCLLTFRGS